jgi:hypothetical protein
MSEQQSSADSADDLRSAGWMVAVHNDYRLNGKPHTFWLFTKGDRAIKGEGDTDQKALDQCRALAGAEPQTAPELTATCQKLLPGGIIDDATYAEIEDALDRADAPATVGGRWLKLHERIAALTAERPAASAEPQSQADSSPQSAPSDDLEDLVARFSKALLAKLKLARANGRSGWEFDDWEEHCQAGLLRHLAKGDPRDVAAYCAFMWHHGWATKAADRQSQAVSAPLASNASDPLETLEGNCWDLRCIDIPTGGGDADIGWNIVEHHMGPPKERIVGRGRSPREALQDATSTLSRPQCGLTASSPAEAAPSQRLPE